MKEERGGNDSLIGRREFLAYAGAGGMGIALPGKFPDYSQSNRTVRPRYKEIMKEVMKYRKIDAHSHILGYDPVKIVESADRVGIEKISISNPVTAGDAKPEQFREMNDIIIKAMKQFPDRFIGQCFINPRYREESLEEIDRCMDFGMVQLGELYTQVKMNDPLYYPIVERCIDLKIPLLMHSADVLEMIRPGYELDRPATSSIAEDFVETARRYPEAMLIHAHIGGGGDWEHKCKTLRSVPNVYIDTSGSVHDEGMIDFALKCLGEDRLLFATDLNFETGVGKILAAHLSERQREKIFFDNYNNLLRKAGNHVD